MSMNRRDLFKFGGSMVAGLALVGSGSRLGWAAKKSNHEPFGLSGNTNPYGPSPATRDVLTKTLPMVNQYGSSIQRELVKQIAEKEGVTTDHIVFSSGSTEVLSSTITNYASDGAELVTADLTYSYIPQYTNRVGGKVIGIPVDKGMKFDLEAIHRRLSADNKLVYICNPNNPTGTLLDGTSMRDFCTSVPKETMVLVDEAYLEFTDNFEDTSMVDLVRKDHNVIVTRTFSKIHGLAGLRVGYAIARPDIAARIASKKMAMFQGPMGSAAAAVSMKDIAFQDFCRARVKEGRDVVYKLCEDLGLEYIRGAGNFVFFDPKMSNAKFKERMLSHGIRAARPFPPKQDWARLTIGTTEEMQIFANALPEIVNV
jgi:histidinol-phosphate aminotransferase